MKVHRSGLPGVSTALLAHVAFVLVVHRRAKKGSGTGFALCTIQCEDWSEVRVP